MGGPTQPATVLRTRSLSPHVRELVLTPTVTPFSYKPGQWISLQLPVGNHPPLVRAYSMADPESSSGQLVLAFDRVPQGAATEYLFGLKEGDQVIFSGPHGRFVLPESSQEDLVFIARYTGIVPVRCMLTHLFSTAPAGQVILSYSAPTHDELIYHHEFTEWASRSGFHYLPLISNSAEEDLKRPVHDWPAVQSLAPYIAGRKDFIPLISGIKAFVRPLRAYLTDLGFERREIRVETYD